MKKKSSLIKENLFYFSSKTLLFLIELIIFLPCSFAQIPTENLQIPSVFYYDADDIDVSKNDEMVTLNGHATILIGDVYFSANKITIQKDRQLVVADGDVKLLYGKEKAIATRIVYDIGFSQLRMDQAEIFSDPLLTDEKFEHDALGLTKAEIVFDQAKQLRTKELELELRRLREKYVNLRNLQYFEINKDPLISKEIKDLTDEYTKLLLRYVRTQYQPNAVLESLPMHEKEKILKRRKSLEKFNKENKNIIKQIVNFSAIQGYIKAKASQIIQKSNGIYFLNDTFITPCRCQSSNNIVVFGFSAQKAEIDIGNYITMTGVTLDVLSVPFFYTPWLKFPIKTKREAGFLIPSGYSSNNSGQVLSFPFFIPLGSHADSTITYENFSQRGSQFSVETRLQLDPERHVYSSVHFIKDKLYKSALENNLNNIQNSILNTNDPIFQSMYRDFRGENISTRWYTSNSFSLDYYFELKANTQFVSDNLYLSDFSKNNTNIIPNAAVFGDTSTASKRFLNQEVDLEYYGDNFVFSIRAQGLKDLFALNPRQTPLRLPRVEFYLLPQSYLNSSLVFSNITTWENVVRPESPLAPISNLPFHPLSPTSLDPPNGPPSFSSSAISLSGSRTYSSFDISLPLPANDYVNASLSTRANGTLYDFSSTEMLKDKNVSLGYLEYKAHLDIPLYSRINFKDKIGQIWGSIVQNITPYIDISYLPTVKKSNFMPSTYQLWYNQDAIFSHAVVTAGMTTEWTIQRESFEKSNNFIPRLQINEDLGVGSPVILGEILKESFTIDELNSAEIFKLTSEQNAFKLFYLWSEKELEDYFQRVSSSDFKRGYIWPEGNYYVKRVLWSTTPLSLSISTGYNFLASKTEEEINNSAGSFVVPVSISKMTDIVGSATLDFNPLLPLRNIWTATYSHAYHRINSLGSSFTITFPYGLDLNYIYGEQVVINPLDQNSFTKKTQHSMSAIYSPIDWLQFGYQWAKSIDPTIYLQFPMNTGGGRDYASSQNITFLNLQDCLDLIFTRNKIQGIPENQATYAIGMQLKIFGYSSGIQQVANYAKQN